jgi:prevent-host-death family protein
MPSSIQFDKDIRSLSDFRANTAALVEQVKTEHRPLILTQHGKSTAVVLDVNDYQQLINKIELLEEITLAKKQIELGEAQNHLDFMADLKLRYKK